MRRQEAGARRGQGALRVPGEELGGGLDGEGAEDLAS